jgi:hypothetical protein
MTFLQELSATSVVQDKLNALTWTNEEKATLDAFYTGTRVWIALERAGGIRKDKDVFLRIFNKAPALLRDHIASTPAEWWTTAKQWVPDLQVRKHCDHDEV